MMGIIFGKSLKEQILDEQLKIMSITRNVDASYKRLDTAEHRERERLGAAIRANKSKEELGGHSQTIAQYIIAKEHLTKQRQSAIHIENRLLTVQNQIQLQSIVKDLDKLVRKVSTKYSEEQTVKTVNSLNAATEHNQIASEALETVFASEKSEASLAADILSEALQNEKIKLNVQLPGKIIKTDNEKEPINRVVEEDLVKRFDALKSKNF